MGPCYHSNSTDSRCSRTPLDTLLYGSFSYHGSAGVGHSSITPMTSMAGSQQVTAGHQQHVAAAWFVFSCSATSPRHLSAEQVVEIYQLATECQALGTELTKQFQNLSGFEAVHCAAAQATAHETINAGCMAHNTAFSAVTANQLDGDHEKFLCQFHAEANQAWKDMNDVIFSHQLKYDSQLVVFISTAEGTLQAKRDKIWSHVHSLVDMASLPHEACLTLALQILDKLPTPPLDLSYCTAIPRMLAYCLESYAFQAWSATGDGDYLLDNNTQASSLLTQKLTYMAGGANLDDHSPSRATSSAGSASSAMLCSPGCPPSHSCSRPPANEKERSRS